MPQNATGQADTPVKAKIQTISVESNKKTINYIDDELTEIYRSAKFTIEGGTLIDKLNRFDGRDENYYNLSENWILKSGKNPDSIDSNDWKIFTTVDIANGMYFTDDETDDNPTAVYVNNGSTIRYVCTADNGEYDNACTFFDYDITNGGIYRDENNAKVGTDIGKESTKMQDNYDNSKNSYYAHSYQSGINHPDNYNNYTQGNVNDKGEIVKLAFGNTNTGTGLGELIWNQLDIRLNRHIKNALNRANMKIVTKEENDSYQVATYGMTTGLDDDENIKYSPGINAPLLFSSETEVIGKTEYADRFDLRFARNGDTYVLNSVIDTNKPENEGKILDNLNKIVHPQSKYTWIYTNNFWPMDYVDQPGESYGTDGHDLKFGSSIYISYRKRL